MFYFKKLLDFEKEKVDLKDKYYIERRIISDGLNAFDRFFFDINQESIYKIAYKIEKSTGWEYCAGSFILPSDFTYINGDIDFHINRVSSNSSIDSMNDRELAFTSENAKLLKRLRELENKRDLYLKKAKNNNPNTIYMTDTKSDKDKRLDALFMQGWLREEANRFILRYHGDGIKRLITTLNIIADNSTDEAYDTINYMSISRDYKRDLLRWASTFSMKGNILFERFNDKIERIAKLDSFSDSFIHDESEFILRYKK